MIYLAAPLFNDMEKQRNEALHTTLRKSGFHTYLPQTDGGVFADESAGEANPSQLRTRIFNSDIQAVKDCDILLFLFDGRVPDEGACFELGMAYALGKRCIGLKTDARSFIDGYDNIMLSESLEAMFYDTDALINHLKNTSDTSFS
ncbi:MAG: nucleoside 2-deoxyribosyltransferase [Oscillospiraceae bacterium]|nr:nucleoside 2-deoxyribosyltransferase [Oscillospiraceae bacterium]